MSTHLPFPVRLLIAVSAISGIYLNSQCVAPSGGGSEAGNARITGMIKNGQGLPAENVIVQILPSDFDPVSDAPFADPGIDTTTADGVFRLDVTRSGRYTIHAVQMVSRLRTLIPDIQVSTAVTKVAECTLQPPGAIEVALPSGVDKGRYLYVPGTTYHVLLDDNDNRALLDSVPAGVIPSITYSSTGRETPMVIGRNVIIRSGETAIFAFRDWAYSKRLVLNTSASGADVKGNVHGFPVLVRLTTDVFDFAQAKPGGIDLRFTSPEGALLPYEIERWDPLTGSAEIWVLIDTIYGNDSTQSIRMYWGNSAVADSSGSAAVFDTADGYQGVWHLGGTREDSAFDATANRYHGVSPDTARPAFGEGVAGKCRDFDGVADCIIMHNTSGSTLNFPADGYYSVSAWVNFDTIDNMERVIVAKGGTQYFLMLTYVPSGLPLWDFAEFNDTDGWQPNMTGATAGQWTLLTGVCLGTMQKLYSNGVLVDSVPDIYAAGSYSRNTSNDLTIGRFLELVSSSTNSGGYCFFKGSIDEVRIESAARGPDWVRLCYMNQRPDNRLVEFR